MPEGLKISNRTGHIFYDTAWIAGVDYDEEAFDDEFEEDYDDEASERNDDDLPGGQFDEIDPDEITEVDDIQDDDEDDDDQGPYGGGNEINEAVAIATEDGDEAAMSADDEVEINPSIDEDEQGDDEDNPEELRVTRSGRVSRPPTKLTLIQHQLFTQAHHTREEYSMESARVIAMAICRMNDIILNPQSDKE